MKMLRRALVALSFAGTIAGVLRLRGKGGVPQLNLQARY